MTFKSPSALRKRAYEFLRSIPSSLLDIFGFSLKASAEEYSVFIHKAVKVLQGNSERHEKMRLQKKYDLPLRPNQEMRELKIVIRLIERKKKRDKGWENGKDSKDNGFTI